MKPYGRELRFECLKLAVAHGNAQKLGPAKIIENAKEFANYIDADDSEEISQKWDESNGLRAKNSLEEITP